MFKKIIGAMVVLFLLAGCSGQPLQNTETSQASQMEVETMAKALFVIAPKDFQIIEYNVPKSVLQKAGVKVVTASLEREAISSSGSLVTVDLLLDKATPDYDAIVFVGGPGASVYFDNEKALALARKFNEQGKVVAAICIAPSILANAGLLEGKRATAFSSESGNLKAKGAAYTGESVTADGNIITANGPSASEAFAKKILGKIR